MMVRCWKAKREVGVDFQCNFLRIRSLGMYVLCQMNDLPSLQNNSLQSNPRERPQREAVDLDL